MSALTVRLADEKHQRLRLLARSRGTTIAALTKWQPSCWLNSIQKRGFLPSHRPAREKLSAVLICSERRLTEVELYLKE